jgi:hypothetical protein
MLLTTREMQMKNIVKYNITYQGGIIKKKKKKLKTGNIFFSNYHKLTYKELNDLLLYM